jgi:alkanesulfonate monooxygenase SsuD/methylene tetrahydromethanopterin reductase-like flavin-dependent oxidoreductase (luciferase family)
MKFGLLYELQLPRPWGPDSEQKLYQEALAEVQLADRLGYDHIWANEHHFLEEYSHCSAPEVFLAACAPITRRIRLGHAVVLSPPNYNPPARVAERLGTLDVISGGRAEWGTGESGSRTEIEGFCVDQERKKEMWAEATEQTANMLAMEPYPGYEGKFFSMPCRNIVPKPVQKPHPPLWLACSRRESIHAAARAGVGALAFAFVDPKDAGKWAQEYYDIIRSEECIPIGHQVNANIAMVTGFSCHHDEDEAIRRGLEAFQYFGYGMGHYYAHGQHRPGRTNLWERFQIARPGLPNVARGNGIGTPTQLRERMDSYQEAGIDQVILLQQAGRNTHQNIIESLELFADEVMPYFKAGESERERKKAAELEPYLKAALGRKVMLPPATDETIPSIGAYGRQIVESASPGEKPVYRLGGHGGFEVVMEDPAEKAEKSA